LCNILFNFNTLYFRKLWGEALEKLNVRIVSLTVLFFFALIFTSTDKAWANEGVVFHNSSSSNQIADSLEDDINDPLEVINRFIFDFNEFVQALLLRPVAALYNENLPLVFRSGVSNFLDNISAPITVANQILQGDPGSAMQTVGRFLVNSTVGIGGLMDVATDLGEPNRSEDFGQTLGRWGVGEGFYLVLPIFGPSNPRDAVGKFLVDSYFDPVGHWISNTDQTKLYWSRKAVDGISEYSSVVDELDQVRKTSVDYYAVIRSLYRQKRKSEISNGNIIDIPTIPDLGHSIDPINVSVGQ
jgi:phospholipid-binding lipoprotein MlaA